MCPNGTFCNALGQCQGQVPQGGACNLTNDCKVSGNCRECTSGNCADGYCCDSACDGSCDTCSATPGTCTLRAKGAVGAPSCAPYICGGASKECTTACATTADCSAGSNCETATGKCKGSDPTGTACVKNETCLSEHCVDGLCCDTACDGQCQACDISTSKGTCSPVVGAPHGVRTACAMATGGDACSARLCDGTKDTTQCVGYVGSDVGCRDLSCANGVETASAACDGAGKCGTGTPVTRPCAPFACGEKSCKTECFSDSDCASGSTCNAATHQCGSAAVCVDDHTLKDAKGAIQDCGVYTCQGNACLKACGSISDCTAGNVCDENGACVPSSQITNRTGDNNDDSGCSMSPSPSGFESNGIVAAAAVFAAIAKRRRRKG